MWVWEIDDHFFFRAEIIKTVANWEFVLIDFSTSSQVTMDELNTASQSATMTTILRLSPMEPSTQVDYWIVRQSPLTILWWQRATMPETSTKDSRQRFRWDFHKIWWNLEIFHTFIFHDLFVSTNLHTNLQFTWFWESLRIDQDSVEFIESLRFNKKNEIFAFLYSQSQKWCENLKSRNFHVQSAVCVDFIHSSWFELWKSRSSIRTYSHFSLRPLSSERIHLTFFKIVLMLRTIRRKS